MREQITDDGDMILASGEEPATVTKSPSGGQTLADYLSINYVHKEELATRTSSLALEHVRLKTDVLQIEDRLKQQERNELQRATVIGNIRGTQTVQATRLTAVGESVFNLQFVVGVLFLAVMAIAVKVFLV